MAAPVRVYAQRLRANITAAQASAIEREVALTGVTASEITRRALDAYLKQPKRRKAS